MQERRQSPMGRIVLDREALYPLQVFLQLRDQAALSTSAMQRAGAIKPKREYLSWCQYFDGG